MDGKGLHILIGGEAGQGLATVGEFLAKGLVRGGFHVLVTQDYLSRIRGGHNTFSIRFGPEPQRSPGQAIDILVALDPLTVGLHTDQMSPDGVILRDAGPDAGLDAPRLRCLDAPIRELAGKRTFENIAALGILCSLLGLDRDIPARLIGETFGKKGQDIVNANLRVLEGAYGWAPPESVPVAQFRRHAEPPNVPRLMLNGNQAIGLGALAAGVKFCSFYPMTPGTSVALTLIKHADEMGLVVEQVEDEIGAVNMALGASYAGARSMVTTSGGGFALMVEGVSLAGMTETPIVAVLAQRPGPATGLPTRTEQADLNLVLYAGHGEFPRAVYAPGSVEQCFHLTHRAFDQAERYQSPVFVLTDQFLADSDRDVEPFDLEGLPEPAAPLFEMEGAEAYERYAVTESGVSPRLIPGFTKGLVVLDSDEHTPDGHLTEDLEVRVVMQDKRLRKEAGMRRDVVPPEYTGDDSPEVLLACWGSTRGAALDAAEVLRRGRPHGGGAPLQPTLAAEFGDVSVPAARGRADGVRGGQRHGATGRPYPQADRLFLSRRRVALRRTSFHGSIYSGSALSRGGHMAEISGYGEFETAWCPGCGNFSILKAVKKALAGLDLHPHQVLMVSGIGQAAKTPHYLRANVFNGLHGRALPAAQAAKLANRQTSRSWCRVRRRLQLRRGRQPLSGRPQTQCGHHACLAHDNQIYGLTKGQASPTTMPRARYQGQPGLGAWYNAAVQPLWPWPWAHAGLVRGPGFFRRNPNHLVDLIQQAVHTPRLRPGGHHAALRLLQQGEHLCLVQRALLPSARGLRPNGPACCLEQEP